MQGLAYIQIHVLQDFSQTEILCMKEELRDKSPTCPGDENIFFDDNILIKRNFEGRDFCFIVYYERHNFALTFAMTIVLGNQLSELSLSFLFKPNKVQLICQG